ncbi:MAG: 3-oxoacyl-[acyl-carrier-protein] reductase [Kineothrix sp.]
MLKGKVALVTGASRGIGREIALTLAGNGASVIVNYNGSRERAEEVVAAITGQGGSAEAIRCSVADFEESGRMVRDILEQYGRVDILVNNAGITRDNLIMRMSEADYDEVMDTNLKGAFHMIRHLSRSFIRQRSGRIINISSVSGVTGNAGQSNYSASKAGLIGLTKSVARELASRGICVNAVAPGFIETEMTEVLSDEIKEGIKRAVPLGKMGTPRDVAELVLFLAGESAGYITGQVLHVDGGMVM